ncbi:MAG: hypothetical protein AAGF12_37565 [Myxococcota bacterium]
MGRNGSHEDAPNEDTPPQTGDDSSGVEDTEAPPTTESGLLDAEAPRTADRELSEQAHDDPLNVHSAVGAESAPASHTPLVAVQDAAMEAPSITRANAPSVVTELGEALSASGEAPPREVAAPTSETRRLFGYARFDADSEGFAAWGGGEYRWGAIALHADVVVSGSPVRFDVGASLTLGAVRFRTMVGLQIDFETMEPEDWVFNPRTYLMVDGEFVNFESWTSFTVPFGGSEVDVFYARNFLVFKAGGLLRVGPQAELTVHLRGQDRGLVSIPAGLRLQLDFTSQYRMAIFLGADGLVDDDTAPVAGRFTFLAAW